MTTNLHKKHIIQKLNLGMFLFFRGFQPGWSLACLKLSHYRKHSPSTFFFSPIVDLYPLVCQRAVVAFPWPDPYLLEMLQICTTFLIQKQMTLNFKMIKSTSFEMVFFYSCIELYGEIVSKNCFGCFKSECGVQ